MRKDYLVGIVIIILVVGALFLSYQNREQRIQEEPRMALKEMVSEILRRGGDITSDMAGYDFSDVPRYPGSIRYAYQQRRGAKEVVTLIVYRSFADMSSVQAFYQQILAEYGWQNVFSEPGLGHFIYQKVSGDSLNLILSPSGPSETYVGMIKAEKSR